MSRERRSPTSRYYGLRPEFFGFVFSSGILGIMATNVFNARQVMRSGIVPILRLGASLAAVGGLWAALDAWTGAGGLFGLAAPLFLFIAANGLIIANSVAGAMTPFPKRAGRCRLWSARCNMGRAWRARACSAPPPTARRDRSPSSSPSPVWARRSAPGPWSPAAQGVEPELGQGHPGQRLQGGDQFVLEAGVLRLRGRGSWRMLRQ